ncbi:MAG: SDR family NAD(P)-dependent oxidoreductase [Pseudomonadota bacterium]
MFRSIVLTGASSGIGRDLALRLSKDGLRLLLIARRLDALEAVAREARNRGATVVCSRLDVREIEAMKDQICSFDDERPVDLVIANAGISAGLTADRGPEAPGIAKVIHEVNVLGVLNTVEPLLPRMIGRRSGHVALMSSLAAHAPLPDMTSYSASKAAVRAYGLALRGALREKGVAVSVICPGFVESAMTARHRGFKPFQITSERAAEVIERGLLRHRGEIVFPWPLALLTWLSNRLPPALADRALQGFRAEILPDE